MNEYHLHAVYVINKRVEKTEEEIPGAAASVCFRQIPLYRSATGFPFKPLEENERP